MRWACVGLVVFSNWANAFNNDPNALFDATRARVEKTTVTWRKVDDIQAACEKESHRRGLGGFGYGVEACSFWDKSFGYDHCTIITKKKTTMAILGHEMRHCVAGSWHD
jgi:hypothetical protein